jgi:transcriptional regulator with XRE-family HTH domain
VIRFLFGETQKHNIGGMFMPANLSLIGSRVKEFRRRAKITQEYLAEQTNLSVKYIGNLENGRKGASLNTIIEIADALGATVDLLLLGNLDSEISAHVCECAELIIDKNYDERDAILEAAIAMSHALRSVR